ncbi:MAG: hypothetical protein J6Y26_03660 [Lachnospiraceae bacterium]|nr:hypothetical protein [Lachnospiraceae bacterium]
MANKKIQIKNANGDLLYPRTTLDNIVSAVGSTVSVSIPTLTNGKLDPSYLPSYVDDIIDLKTIAGTAPTTCAVGDMYFNSTSGNLKIYTATAANTWGTTGATPEAGKIYVNLADSKIYRWSGSAMVEISKQVSTVTSVRAASSALDTVVPTEKAVATALAGKAASSHAHAISDITNLQSTLNGKQGTLTAGTNISISNGTISNTYSYSLPTATASVLGGVKIGSNISIASGVISVADATTSTKGVVTLGDHTAIADSNSASPGGAAQCYAIKVYVADQLDAISGTYVLVSNLVSSLSSVTGTGSGGGDNPATAWAVKDYVDTALSGKQGTLTAGTGISISSGTISCTYSYSLPTASSSVLGGVKIGSNISISSGTISVANGSTSAKGVVQLATVAEATAGTLETKAVTPKGLKTELDKKQGTLTAGTNISISSGTISCTYSYSLPTASASVLGGVKIGSNISIASGVISVADATTSAKGVVTLGDHNAIANSNSASPGGAAQCYAVKAYVADQFDAISGTYVTVSNLVSNLSGVTGTGSGGGDNPPTAWAVKQALASCLTYEELT